MIHANNVTKAFSKVTAVDDLTFHAEAGESIALWGSNGAGKTTFIRCLLGIIRFTGEIEVNGIRVRKQGKRSRNLIGYVPQELSFHDDVRLGHAVRFFASLRNIDPSRGVELLEQVGLTGHEKKRVRDLSGGMKQRLALAVALLSDPPIIVLDEPTSNLDADGRGEVVETLKLLKTQGKTILFASHRPDEVIALGDRVLVMEQGKLIRDTTPQALWPTQGAVQTMRLYLATGGSEQAAADLLREAGHAVNLNGHGLCISIPREQKAVPIRELAEANIPVRDFDLLEDFSIEGGQS